MEMFNKASTFQRYSWLLLVYTLAVIGWGAYVRATGSGAGCGNHWPLCNGEVVPRSAVAETQIEFTHRAMSGIMGIAVVGLWLLARRTVGKRHPAHTMALTACVFLVLEVFLGALLVMGPPSRSAGGIVVLSIHSANTFLLVAAIAMTAWFASTKYVATAAFPRKPRLAVLTCLGLMICAAITGAIAAKGDTLLQGLADDFSSNSSYLVRLRLLHPASAMLAAAVAVWLFSRAARMPALRTGTFWTGGLVVLQLCIGLVNVALLAPIWLQIVHLLVADLLWIALLFLCWRYLEESGKSEAAHQQERLSAMRA